MSQIGVIEDEEEFYEIFLEKWKEYLYKIKSGCHLRQILGHDIENVEDVKANMEQIRIYMRGHNLFDIFYGRFRDRETQLLEKYVEIAPKEDFADILNSINKFIYFESRKLT